MNLLNAASKQESIAIIGMSCRFPKSNNLQEFWELLKNGEHTITRIPDDRWDIDKYYDSDPKEERKTNQQHASLLTKIHDFDPLFFNISPAEAREMNPSQKLILELAWEAIENTNLSFTNVKGSDTGVFIGNIWTDFEHYRKSKNAKVTLHSALGMAANIVANRVSFTLGFTGPSMVIDTGCSASLVALHMACQSLLNNESTMAMVGGVNHILDPDRYIDLSRFGGLSSKGQCSSFDEAADGFVRGEGGCVLLLKKLADAERDGNHIHALIRGSAVNNNGYNDTLPATSIAGQKSLFEMAYRAAGINPADVHYVEAHGTGTRKGDPNEANAIGAFFGEGRKGAKLRIGSVKTNIGHTEAAAGIAGLLKVVLAMKHKMLPASLNFNHPNKDIRFDDLNIEVQTACLPWPVKDKETFKAGLNSFGWGGTNAHVVLEEYVKPKQEIIAATLEIRELYGLPLSAKSAQGLKDYAAAYAKEISNGKDGYFKDLCIATALRKPDFNYRTLISGNSAEQLLIGLHQLIADADESLPYSTLKTNPKVAFIFPGQGGQWLGMGKDLYEQESVFKNAINACDTAFFPFSAWSLVEEIMSTAQDSRIQEIDVIQPVICAIQIALAKLMMSWGIQPQMVIGHSMGEVAAAYIAGALNLEDVAKIICGRSQLMKTLSGQDCGMLLTELNSKEAYQITLRYPALSIAVINSYKSTVLAGDQVAIDEVIKELDKLGVFCRRIRVDVASHSPQMDSLKAPLYRSLAEIRPESTQIPFMSTVYNKVMTGANLGADYWVDNLRKPVQFAATVEQLMNEDYTIFIEINPHPILQNAVKECAEHQGKEVITVGTLQRDQPELAVIVKNLGILYANGYPINWKCFYGNVGSPEIELPGYPFQRESYEIEDLSAQLQNGPIAHKKFPLLGAKIQLADQDHVHYWNSVLDMDKFSYLQDQLIQCSIILPVSCYIEMILEASAEILGPAYVAITQLNFTNQLRMSEGDFFNVQIKLQRNGADKAEAYLFKKEDQGWIQLAHGLLSFAQESPEIDELKGPYTSFLVKGNPDAYLQYCKYIIAPALMDQLLLEPLCNTLMNALGLNPGLELKLISIEQFKLHQVVDSRGEFSVYLHALEHQQNHDDVWSFNVDLRVLDLEHNCILNIIGLKGTAKSKVNSLNLHHMREIPLSFLDEYLLLTTDYDRQQALEQMIILKVSHVIKASISAIKKTMIFKEMGVDSLMAVQLRNLLEKQLEIKLPVGLFWSHPSIQEYAGHVRNLLVMEHSGANEELLELKDHFNNWFVIPKPNPKAHFRVFCFHDAGGSSMLFQGWEKTLDQPSVELVLLEMPEHIRKIENASQGSFKKLILDVMPFIIQLLDRPCLFLGHSMGGILAYEITRELGRRKMAYPKKLIFSSVPEPGLYENKEVDYNNLLNEELGQLYPHLNTINDINVRELFMDFLRADLMLLYNYEFISEEPFNIPIIAIHGAEDERVQQSQMKEWERHTLADFKLISRPGGHRFIEDDHEFLTHLIKEEIRDSMNFIPLH